MKVLVVLCTVVSCLASAQLLRADKMAQLGQDGHDEQHHGEPLLGQDGHDQQDHGQLQQLGQDGHDQQHHGQPLLGGDDHDLVPHGRSALGGDDHDKKAHKKKHGKHNKHKGKKILGGDDHDRKPHKKRVLGGDDHNRQPDDRHTLGGDGHDLQSHDKTLIDADGYDMWELRKLVGSDNHDKRPHKKRMFGQGNHDYKKHGKKMGGGVHDLTHIGVFKNFMKQHNKAYKSQAEFKKRFNIFRQNMKKVHILQQNERGSAKYGPTKFADLTEQEFRKMLGLRHDLKPELSSMRPAVIPEDIELPNEYDWRSQGVVTPVKNQGMCGSCWAFSVTGNVEGQWAIRHKNLISLSEQELVDCDTSDEGCNGGMPENAYDAIQKLGGLESETDYPYDAKDEQCHFNKSMVKVTVNGSVELPQDEIALAKWLTKNGPVSIGINANALQFYVGGVSHPLKFLCNPKDLDHGMLIVGYGVHTTKYLHRKQPYWIIKNSWGSDWGEQGYYRVYRGDGTCGVNLMATSALVP
ncbi:cathepsin L isoform X5 [Procambarus clarkii]|uniref:cathepsin L isoform X5 n=1 Tax=Procambarus clarkii TaxID=6728 RepID=UPI0037443471